mmetsp:Transcript_12314/g.14721  ORF Transcript_12314/g.14721 Transcript_12314/m.14721 type:complete len:142 (-) Transcript_12314:303-728(-)
MIVTEACSLEGQTLNEDDRVVTQVRTAHPTRGDDLAGDDDDVADRYPIEDMLPSTFAVVLVNGNRAGNGQCVFRLKVGQHNSPLLHLVHVVDVKVDQNKVNWQWYRPHNNAFTVPSTKRMDKEGCRCGPWIRQGGSPWSMH